jgi:hypothetical protein
MIRRLSSVPCKHARKNNSIILYTSVLVGPIGNPCALPKISQSILNSRRFGECRERPISPPSIMNFTIHLTFPSLSSSFAVEGRGRIASRDAT